VAAAVAERVHLGLKALGMEVYTACVSADPVSTSPRTTTTALASNTLRCLLGGAGIGFVPCGRRLCALGPSPRRLHADCLDAAEHVASTHKSRAVSPLWGPAEVDALAGPMAAAGGKAARNKDGSWTVQPAGQVRTR
jgi:hypothetical protein